MKDGLKKV